MAGLVATLHPNIDHWQERVDLAAAFRWTARMDLHEAVANHFSLSVNDDGTQFLMNPNQRHFSRVKASDLLLIDANNPDTLKGPDAPDPTAWGLHGTIHRTHPHARCAMHVHSPFATALACLADSTVPPIDQNTATFFNRYVVDEGYGGLAFQDEAERCAALLSDPKKKVMIMGNHGLMVVGTTVAETFDRLYYFERAVGNYIRALWTGKPLRYLSDAVAEKVASQQEAYPDSEGRHLGELKAILDEEGSNYAS
ncbi:MAG TPA: class II aldolase and adducin N-terminal domain-containing protein [Paenirhodobacter sp.]